MSDDKKEPMVTEAQTQEILMADVMLRLTTIESLLISKNLLTKEEIVKTATDIANQVSILIKEKMSVSKDLNEFISKLKE